MGQIAERCQSAQHTTAEPLPVAITGKSRVSTCAE
jgi:hypothetical protein